jgi:hypothetical protein
VGYRLVAPGVWWWSSVSAACMGVNPFSHSGVPALRLTTLSRQGNWACCCLLGLTASPTPASRITEAHAGHGLRAPSNGSKGRKLAARAILEPAQALVIRSCRARLHRESRWWGPLASGT